MALKIITDNGIVIPTVIKGIIPFDFSGVNEFYVRIEEQSSDKDTNYIQVKWYTLEVDEETVTDQAGEPVSFLTRNYHHPLDADGISYKRQAYNYLKTLPEFEGAIDC